MKQAPSVSRLLPLPDVRIRDSFWSYYLDLVRNVVVPYQWDALNDRVPNAARSGAIRNFKIAAGLEDGEFCGMVFQDSDVAKWLEAVGYLLASERDPELERVADEVVELIAKAQHDDGYLNTYYTIKEPDNRWTNLAECHELYCAGHLIEAAVAYYQATGKRNILDVVCKLADHIDEVFGPSPDKLQGYDGHPEIELALMKLYEVTGNDKYLRLCQFFLNERGKEPHFYDLEFRKRGGTTHFGPGMIRNKKYSQAHLPIHMQQYADGHAVRFVYLCTGMAHLAAVTGDADLLQTCKTLWDSMTSKRMYITGGIGSQSHGEAFTMDYDLPNDTAYAETCASIGLVFFAQRMVMADPDGRYVDVMERALYNAVIGGLSRDGRSFFYVNPLEVHPQACRENQIYHHVKPVRQGWFGCACCPPNLARVIASLGQYIYTVRGNTVYANLYIGSEAKLEVDGNQVVIRQQSRYPWDGNITFTIQSQEATAMTIALRIPGWCHQATVLVNGEEQRMDVHRGYVELHRVWRSGDVIKLVLPMPIHRMKGHPLIRQTAGKTALQRGPLVYCLEEADNGPHLHLVQLPSTSRLELGHDPHLFGGMDVIWAQGTRRSAENWGDALYRQDVRTETEKVMLKFVPYFVWANRGEVEMRVWVDEG